VGSLGVLSEAAALGLYAGSVTTRHATIDMQAVWRDTSSVNLSAVGGREEVSVASLAAVSSSVRDVLKQGDDATREFASAVGGFTVVFRGAALPAWAVHSRDALRRNATHAVICAVWSSDRWEATALAWSRDTPTGREAVCELGDVPTSALVARLYAPTSSGSATQSPTPEGTPSQAVSSTRSLPSRTLPPEPPSKFAGASDVKPADTTYQTIAGIVLGALVVLAIAVWIVVTLVRRKRSSTKNDEAKNRYFDQSPTVVEMYEQIVRRATEAAPSLPTRESAAEMNVPSRGPLSAERVVIVDQPMRLPESVVAEL
jgi:hypothetical protein